MERDKVERDVEKAQNRLEAIQRQLATDEERVYELERVHIPDANAKFYGRE